MHFKDAVCFRENTDPSCSAVRSGACSQDDRPETICCAEVCDDSENPTLQECAAVNGGLPATESACINQCTTNVWTWEYRECLLNDLYYGNPPYNGCFICDGLAP